MARDLPTQSGYVSGFPQLINDRAKCDFFGSIGALMPLETAPTQFGMNSNSPQVKPYRQSMQSQQSTTDAQVISQEQPRRMDEPTPKTSMKYGDADWEPHLPKIKQLYLEEDKSLKDTMKVMETTYGFVASEKAYKEKAKKLKWFKNLPTPVAHRMVRIAEARSEAGSKTYFHYGDRPWTVEKAQESLERAVARGYDITSDVPSAESLGLKCVTPPSASPLIHPPPTPPAHRVWTPISAPHSPHQDYPRLVWHGYNRAGIEKVKEEAQALHRSGNLNEAEKKYREALAGFEALASPIHKDTMAVAYQLADLYAQADRMLDADHVLDRLNRMCVERLGPQRVRTRQHFCRVAELYQKWLRPEDAEIMWYRVFEARGGEAVDSNLSADALDLSTSTLSPLQNAINDGTNACTGSSIGPTVIEGYLGVGNARIERKPLAMDLLSNLIKQYQSNPQENSERLLRTHCTSIDLYERFNRPDDVQAALIHAEQSFWAIVDLEGVRTNSFLKICIELARLHIKFGHPRVAENVLEKVSRVAEAAFNMDDDRMITLFVRIGRMYWIESSWDDAREWFEQAYALSCSIHGVRCRSTKRLERALEERSCAFLLSDSEPY